MHNESLELSFLSIFSVTSFFSFLLIHKFSNKILGGFLLDDDFTKPQAFHKDNIPRCGGLASVLSFLIFIILSEILFSLIYLEYLILGTGLFLIGFFEDLKISLSPKKRLIYMILFLIVTTKFLSLEINGIDLIFLNSILKVEIFSLIFIVLCFLFIINGANLLDGFNGLLGLQLIIINSILLYINIENNFQEFSIFLTSQIIILLIFLLFNFPKSKLFMGDGGAYFFGALTALNVITTNNSSPNISSFFFCILLFYLFFEVCFSFFRKIAQNKSPIKPDRNHLHMLLFKIIEKKYPGKDCNYLNSIIINIIYFLFILPSFFIKENGLLCKYWFFMLIIIYILIYFRLNSFLKKKIDI